jgi:hypothetical protein
MELRVVKVGLKLKSLASDVAGYIWQSWRRSFGGCIKVQSTEYIGGSAL